MEGLIRKITEMKLSMDIIDGYNENAKDYCESLLERVKNANIKKSELESLLNRYYKEIEEQEELIKAFEDRKERLMSLQNKKIPKCLLNEESSLSNQDHIIKEITNLDISLRDKTWIDAHKTKENVNPFFEPLMVNNTFTEETSSFANSTFLKKELVNVTPKPRRDLEVSVNFVANEEFSQIPGYMRGRVTMDNINEFINIFNVTLTKKYELLKKAKKNKSKSELEQCLLWKEQEVGELKGTYFCTAEDLDKLGNIKIGNKKYLSIITMLRHIKRIKEVRNMKIIYYVACF
ncbi:spindle and kinetochore-associated protein 1 isoform X2 [Halyomorpha halys]|nr:spindle and kinetochore-associated protein 1 isoform X2 [Halyomorpha halys]